MATRAIKLKIVQPRTKEGTEADAHCGRPTAKSTRQPVTMRMHGDLDAATQWLRSPAPALDNEAPLEFATTEAGGRCVETLIGRIRHGEFS